MEEILQAIRQAALKPDAWAKVMHELSKYMGVTGSQLASVDHGNGNAFWSRSTRRGIDEMMAKVGATCEPVLFAAANPHWRTFTDYDYINETQIDRSAFYALNAEYDIRYRMGLRLIDHPSISRAMVIFWDKKQGHADRHHFEKIRPIIEPIRLSAHVALAMGDDLSSERLLIENLARSQSAAAIMDADANIVLSNGLMDLILQKQDGISSFRQRFLFEDAQSQSELVSLVQRASCAARNNLVSGGGILAAPRPSDLPAYVVMVSPLPKKEQFLGDAKGLVLVVVHDTTEATHVERAIYMDGFGLTDAEADVAAWFLNGSNLEEIAKRRGVSLHTVRQQFKSVRKKTGTRGQAELAVLLASMSRL